MSGGEGAGMAGSAVPPPGAVLLSVSGLRGPEDHAAVLAALRQRDPAGVVWTDWPRGLVAVQTDHPPEALRVAVQDAGFITAWLAHPPMEVSAGGVGAAIVRLIGYGFVGLVLGMLLGAALGIGNVMLNPVCGSPGDSGACAMGIPAIAIGAGLLGAAAGAVLALARIARRR
ncbi:hypothetical protein GXW74_22750 [Roseomonas eburnea]|uniref:Uncharacterized protein n=1 Tax=Neoroseomonas eburnea TaxID=1346889 RepID=A0A9X9XHY7_9PROT|nr:hypothetical protein [Neoroseomonas eburnea]MBR0683323.1 hypothetical protein [Neoroseomonas eburnea]